MKKIILSIFTGFLLFLGAANINASGTAAIGITSSGTPTVGKDITVTVSFTNITGVEGGVSALDYNLEFDDTHLEFKSATAGSSVPGPNSNTAIHKYIFLDLTGASGMTSPAPIFTYTFTVLKAGTSQVAVDVIEAADTWGELTTVSAVTPLSVSSAAASSNNNLSSLAVSGQTLTPAFNASTTSYTVNVPWGTTSANVTAAAADSGAKISGTGNKNLNVGNNTVTVKVTAANGDVKDYTVNIVRAEDTRSTNNNLTALSISGHTITPTFNASTTAYSATVPNDVTSVTVNATKSDNKATMTITGASSLNVGNNTITVRVTAENGSVKTYTINVTREADNRSHDTTLSDLEVTGHSLTPVFNSSTREYSMVVPYEVVDAPIKATANHNLSTINITGDKGLQVGLNIIKVEVTAENGDKDSYIINVTREAEVVVDLSGDATLKGIEIPGYNLNPNFENDISVYAVNVSNDVTSLNVNVLVNHPKATVEITGNTDFVVGVNPIKIKVTAEDGTVKNYIINANREGVTETVSTKSNDNYLLSLGAKNYEIDFDKNLNSYNIEVPFEITSLNLNYEVSDYSARVKVTGNQGFVIGVNAVEVQVTAEDGSIRIYTLNVNRSPLFSNNKLSEIKIDGYLIDGFDPNRSSYDITVSDMDRLNLEVKSLNEKAKITISGNSNLQEGNNSILIQVEDENGFVRYYNIDVYKEFKESLMSSIFPWLMLGLIAIIMLCIVLIIILATRRKQVIEIATANLQPQLQGQQAPAIEFKPEFNFGSKNDSDNRQISEGHTPRIGQQVNDIYDEVVTKDEIIDAINNKDTEALKILYEQEMLNRKKEEMKNSRSNDDDFII